MRTKYLTTRIVDNQKLYCIDHPLFKATVSEFGGQLLSFQDQQNQEWLWLSNQAVKDGSKAIRGGVPVCWPWFGPAKDNQQPQHGYARIVNWSVINVDESEQILEVTLKPDFDHSDYQVEGLSLFMKLSFSHELCIQLHTENTSQQSITFSQAIHSYFKVQDIHNVVIHGLEGCSYLDQIEDKIKSSPNPLKIEKWTDSIYAVTQPSSPISIIEADCGRTVIEGQGHDSVVIWNPWSNGSANMSDFEDEGYRNMVCVEMANTGSLHLPPRGSHTLTQRIKKGK